jgi:ectoine hydroxylase-related dioxygenase (phytanoyl-CoA dioxygenase family)
VLPGSHNASLPLHAVLPEAHAEGAHLSVDHSVLSDQPGQVTLSARPGDAVVIDYRLLHGTHANATAERRDCLLLSFTPSWRDLPPDVRAHLIRHPAQPTLEERPLLASWRAELLPSFDGVPADLPLNRVAPARFAVAG